MSGTARVVRFYLHSLNSISPKLFRLKDFVVLVRTTAVSIIPRATSRPNKIKEQGENKM
jgi:hypothetical protein